MARSARSERMSAPGGDNPWQRVRDSARSNRKLVDMATADAVSKRGVGTFNEALLNGLKHYTPGKGRAFSDKKLSPNKSGNNDIGFTSMLGGGDSKGASSSLAGDYRGVSGGAGAGGDYASVVVRGRDVGRGASGALGGPVDRIIVLSDGTSVVRGRVTGDSTAASAGGAGASSVGSRAEAISLYSGLGGPRSAAGGSAESVAARAWSAISGGGATGLGATRGSDGPSAGQAALSGVTGASAGGDGASAGQAALSGVTGVSARGSDGPSLGGPGNWVRREGGILSTSPESTALPGPGGTSGSSGIESIGPGAPVFTSDGRLLPAGRSGIQIGGPSGDGSRLLPEAGSSSASPGGRPAEIMAPQAGREVGAPPMIGAPAGARIEGGPQIGSPAAIGDQAGRGAGNAIEAGPAPVARIEAPQNRGELPAGRVVDARPGANQGEISAQSQPEQLGPGAAGQLPEGSSIQSIPGSSSDGRSIQAPQDTPRAIDQPSSATTGAIEGGPRQIPTREVPGSGNVIDSRPAARIEAPGSQSDRQPAITAGQSGPESAERQIGTPQEALNLPGTERPALQQPGDSQAAPQLRGNDQPAAIQAPEGTGEQRVIEPGREAPRDGQPVLQSPQDSSSQVIDAPRQPTGTGRTINGQPPARIEDQAATPENRLDEHSVVPGQETGLTGGRPEDPATMQTPEALPPGTSTQGELPASTGRSPEQIADARERGALPPGSQTPEQARLTTGQPIDPVRSAEQLQATPQGMIEGLELPGSPAEAASVNYIPEERPEIARPQGTEQGDQPVQAPQNVSGATPGIAGARQGQEVRGGQQPPAIGGANDQLRAGERPVRPQQERPRNTRGSRREGVANRPEEVVDVKPVVGTDGVERWTAQPVDEKPAGQVGSERPNDQTSGDNRSDVRKEQQ